MAINFGNDNIKDIYVGSDKIKEVYYGSEKVWGGIKDGYWVHKDTNAVTYFGLEDSSIENGIMSPPSWALDCSEVQIPSGVTSLDDYLFNNCTSLTSITLPEGVTSLGRDVFYMCTSLTSVTLSESLTSIGTDCFSFCESLTSITLPESVNSLGGDCFWGCTSLTLVTVLPATPPSLGYGSFDNVHPSFNIQVRSPYVNDYKTATNWINYADKISAIEPIQNGGWKHKDTGVWTEFNEFYPHYGDTGGIIDFNGYAVIEPNSVGNVAHNISELIIREGCNKVYNLGLTQNPDTQEWLYEHLTLMDFPSTITEIGEEGNTIFNGLANVEVVKIRAITPPEIRVGNMQSPQAKIYVPDAAVATYKSHPNTSAYAALIFPLSDIE